MDTQSSLFSIQADRARSQVLSGAHDFSIQTANITTVGRDNVNITNYYLREGPEDEEVSVDVVLNWLEGPSYRQIHLTALAQRTANTVTSFLKSEEFRQFVEDEFVIIWGTGLPGSGKTVLVSVTVHDLQNRFQERKDVSVVYAYLRYSERRTYHQILASLLSQLVESHDVAYRHVAPICRRAQRTKEKITEPEMIQGLREACRALTKVFIVVDGLDEVDDDIKEALLETLPSLGANLMIVSRPLDLFTSYTPKAIFVNIQARTGDIELLVLHKINKSVSLKAILRGDSTLTKRLCDQVKEKSKGMFLLASLQMDSLRSSRSINSLFKCLEKLPSKLYDMYHLTMERIEAQSDEDASIAKRVFIWLAYSKNPHPMTVADLQDALTFSYSNLSYDSGDTIPESLMLAPCLGLVTVQETRPWKRREVRVIHYTTMEFMRSILLLGSPNPHDFLATSCIVHLAEVEIERWEPNDVVKCLDSWHPAVTCDNLLRYAYQYGWYHAVDSQEHGELDPFIISFLSNCKSYPVLFSGPPDDSSVSGIDLAAYYGLVKAITSGSVPYVKLDRRNSPLHFAAVAGQVEALHGLLSSFSGLDIRSTGTCGKTILHLAVERDRPSMVAELLSMYDSSPPFLGRLDVLNAQDDDGRSPLMHACRRSDEAMVRRLIIQGDALVGLSERDAIAALSSACENSPHGDAITKLLRDMLPDLPVQFQATVDIDKRNELFLAACRCGLQGTVRWMLDEDGGIRNAVSDSETGKGILVKVFQGTNNTPSPAIIELLLASGADTHTRDLVKGRSPFLWAVGRARADDEIIVKLLLRFAPTIDILERDTEGNTALILAASCGSPSRIRFLLSQGGMNAAYVNAQNSLDGWSALMHCCALDSNHHGSAQSIRAILAHPSIDLSLRNEEGLSALEVALYGRYYYPLEERQCDFIDALLELGHFAPSAIRQGLIFAFTSGSLVAAARMLIEAAKPDVGAFRRSLEDQDTIVLLAIACRRSRGLECRMFFDMIMYHCFVGLVDPVRFCSNRREYTHCYCPFCDPW
ncbi:hypothetical protein D9611_014368 [Ephemerocybe angulata]|uniref:Nephrocystin 3-like N-terminal domain-containing protein n=1 Tax=Ephemerocybe angulata TaxID=980116 RepID=A0A8H5F9J7_9AGAR|nr:hypothetical protein D9611_014368 [Tulosesus angulatus]